MKTHFLSAAALLGLCGLAQGQVTYDYVGAPIAILDGGTPSNGTPGPAAVCTVNVPTAGTITDVNVSFQINHTWQGDIRIRLVGPGGTSVDLVNRPGVAIKQGASTGFGFSTDNFGTAGTPATAIRFIADDEAAAGTIYDDAVGLPGPPGPGTAVATLAIAGSHRVCTLTNLSVFDGTNQLGDWKLIVADHAGGDTGFINNFAVVITTAAPPSCYADCDGVGGLTGNDFQCFLDKFVANASYADCDGVGGLTGNDFQCFLNKFVAGCS